MFNKKTLSALTAGSLALGTIAISPVSYANPPHPPELVGGDFGQQEYGELWHMKTFWDKTYDHRPWLKLDLCFYFYNPDTYGPFLNHTQTRYGWYVMNYPQYLWTGAATKEGDQVFMNGVRRFWWSSPLPFTYPEYMQWQLVSKDIGVGHWRFWFNEKPRYYRHLNMTMERLDKKCQLPKKIQEGVTTQKMTEPPADIDTTDPEAMLLYFGPDIDVGDIDVGDGGEDGGDEGDGQDGGSCETGYPNPTYKFDPDRNTGVLTLPAVDFQTINPLFPVWSTQEDAFSAILELVPGTGYFRIIDAKSKE
jgi:hypothetical protein